MTLISKCFLQTCNNFCHKNSDMCKILEQLVCYYWNLDKYFHLLVSGYEWKIRAETDIRYRPMLQGKLSPDSNSLRANACQVSMGNLIPLDKTGLEKNTKEAVLSNGHIFRILRTPLCGEKPLRFLWKCPDWTRVDQCQTQTGIKIHRSYNSFVKISLAGMKLC